MSRARELISMNIYCFMARDWVLAQVFLIIGELTALIPAYLGMIPEEIVLPAVDLPLIDFSDVLVNLFSATISVNGIILGFSSVFVIYYRRWLDNRIDSLGEKEGKARSKEKKREYKFRWETWMHVRDHYSRFSKNYIMVPLFAIAFQIISFIYTYTSSFFVLVNMLVNLHVLFVVLGGFYPLMKIALWYRME